MIPKKTIRGLEEYLAVDYKNVLDKARRAKVEKDNFTFRLSVGVVKKFKATCGRQEVSAAQLIESFMLEYSEAFSPAPPAPHGLRGNKGLAKKS